MAASIRVVRTLHDVIGLKAAVDCVTNLLEKKFYKRHGFRTAAIIPNAYGYLLDRHVMRRTR